MAIIMKSSRLSKIIIGSALALSIPLAAQTDTVVESATSPAVSEPSAIPSGDDVPDFTTYNSAQKEKHSDQRIESMQEVLARTVGLQRVARQQKDIIKLNCVNDKLLQIKQLMNIADSARTSLIEAIAQGDAEAANHYASQIHITSSKLDMLGNEAEACVGEDMAFLGDTEVTVEGNGHPDDPTSTGDIADPHGDRGIERPAYASPFL